MTLFLAFVLLWSVGAPWGLYGLAVVLWLGRIVWYAGLTGAAARKAVRWH